MLTLFSVLSCLQICKSLYIFTGIMLLIFFSLVATFKSIFKYQGAIIRYRRSANITVLYSTT